MSKAVVASLLAQLPPHRARSIFRRLCGCVRRLHGKGRCEEMPVQSLIAITPPMMNYCYP